MVEQGPHPAGGERARRVARLLRGASDCTLIGTRSGIRVEGAALPAGATGEVCLVGGACLQVPGQEPDAFLDMPSAPATAEVVVRLAGRPDERLSVPLRAAYANGEHCAVSGYQRSLRLQAGPTSVDP